MKDTNIFSTDFQVSTMFMCNDATVKGGTSYPITVTKGLRAQDISRCMQGDSSGRGLGLG